MATIYLSLSTKADSNKQQEILIRFSHGRINQRGKTNLFIPVEYWDDEAGQIIIPNFRLMNDGSRQIKTRLTFLSERLNTLLSVIQATFNNADKNSIGPDWLKSAIDRFNFPEKYITTDSELNTKFSFFDTFDEFLHKRKLSDVRKKNYMVLRRILQRYETVAGINQKRAYKLELDNITADTIEDFESFLRNEHALYDEFKFLYDKSPADRKPLKPQPRGQNTINALFNKLRAFFNWCYDNNKMTNKPFKNYESKPDVFGTPYYITIDERNTIYNTDLSHRPQLAVQRDIFVFQCLIGCRVSDLYRMRNGHIIRGAIEYVPRKTRDDRPVPVRVPLTETAKEILKRYEGNDAEGRILPFISEQKYNRSIKTIFTLAGITRIVTVINPTTREEEKRPINEVASSHLARRAFVGNLYKRVKDPNLVGALSGHKEGSKAFARYRDIDEEMKYDLVKMLE